MALVHGGDDAAKGDGRYCLIIPRGDWTECRLRFPWAGQSPANRPRAAACFTVTTWLPVADRISAQRLADLLARHGHLGELRARVSNGGEVAGSRRAEQAAWVEEECADLKFAADKATVVRAAARPAPHLARPGGDRAQPGRLSTNRLCDGRRVRLTRNRAEMPVTRMSRMKPGPDRRSSAAGWRPAGRPGRSRA